MRKEAIILIIILGVLSIFCGIYFLYPANNLNQIPPNSPNLKQTDCTGAGEPASYIKPCCKGLDKIEIPAAISIEDTCYNLPSDATVSRPQEFICLDCGNGVCEAEESVCTCKEDCTGKGKSTFKSVEEFCYSFIKINECGYSYAKEMPLCRLCS